MRSPPAPPIGRSMHDLTLIWVPATQYASAAHRETRRVPPAALPAFAPIGPSDA